jgi:hypothetical protein
MNQFQTWARQASGSSAAYSCLFPPNLGSVPASQLAAGRTHSRNGVAGDGFPDRRCSYWPNIGTNVLVKSEPLGLACLSDQLLKHVGIASDCSAMLLP